MVNIIRKIKLWMKKQSFHPTLLASLFNPAFIARRGLYDAIIKQSPLLNGKLLDYGCGSKPYKDLFLNADEYIGCDVKISGHDHKESVVDYFIDGKTLPFKNEEFDAVVSFETFEHVFNLPQMLDEINRVTKCSGFLLVSIPFSWAEHEAPYDFARYTSFGISYLLKESGYEILNIEKTSTHVLAIFQLLIVYLYTNVLPKNRLIYLFYLIILFPLTIFAYMFNFLLPKKYDMFCGMVVLAKKNRKFDKNENIPN